MKKIIALFLLSVSNILNGAEPPPNCPNLYIRYTGDRNGINLGFETLPGGKYWLQGSTNLTDWTCITNFTATGFVFSTFISADFAPTDRQHYIRVKYICPNQ